jgi:hypothetical protein
VALSFWRRIETEGHNHRWLDLGAAVELRAGAKLLAAGVEYYGPLRSSDRSPRHWPPYALGLMEPGPGSQEGDRGLSVTSPYPIRSVNRPAAQGHIEGGVMIGRAGLFGKRQERGLDRHRGLQRYRQLQVGDDSRSSCERASSRWAMRVPTTVRRDGFRGPDSCLIVLSGLPASARWDGLVLAGIKEA